MANDKRFIDGKPFSDYSTHSGEEIKFNKFNWFDETYILKNNECPQCSGCGKGFIDPKLPEDGNYDTAIATMNESLEKYIQIQIEIELNLLRIKTEQKVRNRYSKFRQQNEDD